MEASKRRELLLKLFHQAQSCTDCALSESRSNVVFGAGNADADLMFIGEAPGASEDKEGLPFVGAAGKLLNQLLQDVGLNREDVFIANVLKCRPPNNRDPEAGEIQACQNYLFEQIALIQPRVICTLGNFATKLIREDQTGISQVHGKAETKLVGRRVVRLVPIYHPAAALYNRSTLQLLRDDFKLLTELLELPHPQQLEPVLEEVVEEVAATAGQSDDQQLGLFGSQ